MEVELRVPNLLIRLERTNQVPTSLTENINGLLVVGKDKKPLVFVVVFHIPADLEVSREENLVASHPLHVLELVLLQVLKKEPSPLLVDLANYVVSIEVVLVRDVSFNSTEQHSLRLEKKLQGQFVLVLQVSLVNANAPGP